MKLVRAGAVVLFGIFIFITLISLLIPGKVVTAKAVAIQADSLKLFNEISNLQNWKKWHPVFIQDSMNIAFNTTGGRVESAEWFTKNKKNSIIITEKKYPTVKFLLKRDGEIDNENTISLMQVQEQGNVQVQWISIVKLKWYPWEKFSGIFIEKMAGQGYETALASLKNYAEATP